MKMHSSHIFLFSASQLQCEQTKAVLAASWAQFWTHPVRSLTLHLLAYFLGNKLRGKRVNFIGSLALIEL